MRILTGIFLSILSISTFAQQQYDIVKIATNTGSNAYVAGVTNWTPGGITYFGTTKLQFVGANTGSSTLAINGGPLTLQKLSGGSLVNLVSGDIIDGYFYDVTYNGTFFVIELPGGSGFTLTDGNGTTANGSAVDLGGDVATAVALDIGASGSITIAPTSDPDLSFGIGPSGIGIQTGGATLFFDQSSEDITITDTRGSPKGAIYAADYSATMPDLALIHKGYVDDKLDLKAPLASPALTGVPTAPTASLGTNTTQLATTAFTKAAVDAKNVTTRNRLPSVTKTASFTLAKSDTSKLIVLDGSALMTITLADFSGGPNMQFAFVRDSTQTDTVYFNAGGQAVQFSGGKGIPPEGFAYISYSQSLNKFFIATGSTSSGGGGTGTVTDVSIVPANGFSGSVATSTTTPALTITTSITGLLKGNGTAVSAASAGTDYENPLTFSTGLTRSTNTVTVNTSQNIATLSNLTSNGIVTTSGGTGTLSVTATTGTGNVTLNNSPTLINPALGTPVSGTLTNATGLPISTGVSGLGTGIAPALAINTGSAGAPVLLNGAGGTPSSITLTNATGTASGLTAGTATAMATARTIGTLTGDATSAGSSYDGSANNTNAVTVTKINGTSFAGLATGILKNTTGTGVPSIAVSGTDYYAPGGTDVAIADGGTGASTAQAGFNALSPLTTQGDIIFHDGTNSTRLAKSASATRYLSNTGTSNNPAWAQVDLTTGVTNRLPLSNVAQIGGFTVLGNSSTSTADAAALSESSIRKIIFNTKKYDRIYSTFLGGTSEFLSSVSGTGATVSYSAIGGATNHNGIARMSSGSTLTGISFLRTGNLSAINLSVGEISYDAAVRTPTSLSDITDTYILYSGLSNDNSAEPAHGVYFRYTHGTNSGKWQLISRNSSTETAVDTGVTVAVSTFYRTTIIINAAGTSAEGFIDGTSIGTITTNLPSTNPIGITTGIRKTLGTTNTQFDCDFIDVIIELTSSR